MSRVLAKCGLTPHGPAPAGFSFDVSLTWDGRRHLTCEFAVRGPISKLRVPPPARAARADDLWKATCFEAFIGSGEVESYLEFNFSPSHRWAAYSFDGYRSGMTPLPGVSVDIGHEGSAADRLMLTADVDLGAAATAMPGRIGLSAILEHRDGEKSYWALAHPPGQADFHHPACFALQL